MPTHKYIKVEPNTSEYGFGRSGTNTLKKVYSSSPVYKKDLTDEKVTEMFDTFVMGDTTDDGGHMFGVVSLSYGGAPDGTVKSDIPGGPASPYVPNPTSPGEGNGADPTKKPEAPEGFGKTPNAGSYGNGGALTIPLDTSKKIAKNKMGQWVLGKSYTE